MNTTRSTHRRWWLLAVAMLAVSLAGFAHVLNQAGTGAAPSPTEPEPPREQGKTIWCFGHVDLEDGVRKIHPLQPGRVAEVVVREGETVAAGAPLLRIEDKVGRLRLDEAKLAIDAAQAELEASRKKPKQHEGLIEQQKLAIQAAQRNVAALKLALESKQALQAKVGGVSKIDIDATEAAYDTAQLTVKGEEWKLKVLQVQDPKAEEKLAELKLALANARQEQAKLASDEYTITAPMAGTVLRVMVGKGDTISGSPQQPAIWFAPDGPRLIRAEVEQAFASRVAEGQSARIEDDTHAGGSWTGRVIRVSDWYTHQRSTLQEPLQFNDVRTLECLVALDPNQHKLRIGQRMRVHITISK